MRRQKYPRMASLQEAHEVSGISYDGLRKLCRTGKIVYFRVGAKYMVNMDFLMDYYTTGRSIEEYQEDYRKMKEETLAEEESQECCRAL